MDELFKNSLLGQLTELGLNPSVQDEPNPLAIKINGDIKDSPFADNPIKKTGENTDKNNEAADDNVANRRLNDLDLNILQDSAIKKAGDKFSGSSAFGKFIYRYFPNLYKGYLIKKALCKLKTLNQTANELVSTKIPYGESDERYDALIENISSANTIHAKLIKKI